MRISSCRSWGLGLLSAALVLGIFPAPRGRAEEPDPLVHRVQSHLRSIGLEYEVSLEPSLRGRSIPGGFLVESPETLFNVILPARGLDYDMVSLRHLRLRARRRPWFGPEKPRGTIPAGFAERKSRLELDTSSARAVVEALEARYGMPVVLDYRIADYEKVKGPLEADSLEEALGALEREKGWQWHVAGSLLVLLPSAEEQVLGLPNETGQKWIYAGAPLDAVVSQLAVSFGVDFEVAESLLPQTISGTLEGATLGRLLDRLSALGECAYALADHQVYLAPQKEIQVRPLASGSRKVRVSLELLEVPEKRWEELKIAEFLIRFPPPSPEEQETFLNRVRRASGVHSVAKTAVLIESGTQAEVTVPLGERAAPDARYLIRMLPFLSEGEWIQLRLLLDFETAPRSTLAGAMRPPGLFEQPMRADFLVQDGQHLLLQGAVWKQDKKTSVFLIALQPVLESPGADAILSFSAKQPRWHGPWDIRQEGDPERAGVHPSGLPAPTRRISGERSP